jgi:hypothetical protein
MMASDEIMESLIDCGKGTKFTNDREADIKTVLIGRWNRDRDTINAYLNHSKYLNDTTMKKLIEAEAPKVFFEQIQVEKSRTVNLFEKDHLATHEITGKISKLVLGWWKEYIVNKKKIKFSGQGKASASPKTKASGTAEGQSEACAGSPGAAAGDGSDLPGSPGSPEKEKTEHGDMWDLGTSIMEAGIKFVACGEHIKAGLSDAELLVELQGLQTMIEEIEADIDPVLKELDLSLALY